MIKNILKVASAFSYEEEAIPSLLTQVVLFNTISDCAAMSPVPIPATAVLAETFTTTLTSRADSATTTASTWGEQFAWPPGGNSLPFWIAIFIICPVIMVMVGWMVWECKFGSEGNDLVKQALKEKQKEANKKPVKIKPAQIGRPMPIRK